VLPMSCALLSHKRTRLTKGVILVGHANNGHFGGGSVVVKHHYADWEVICLWRFNAFISRS
jgi:hypothetical protein